MRRGALAALLEPVHASFAPSNLAYGKDALSMRGWNLTSAPVVDFSMRAVTRDTTLANLADASRDPRVEMDAADLACIRRNAGRVAVRAGEEGPMLMGLTYTSDTHPHRDAQDLQTEMVNASGMRFEMMPTQVAVALALVRVPLTCACARGHASHRTSRSQVLRERANVRGLDGQYAAPAPSPYSVPVLNILSAAPGEPP